MYISLRNLKNISLIVISSYWCQTIIKRIETDPGQEEEKEEEEKEEEVEEEEEDWNVFGTTSIDSDRIYALTVIT